jgi:hypothetical protein
MGLTTAKAVGSPSCTGGPLASLEVASMTAFWDSAKREAKPPAVTLCTLLARRDHQAGLLLNEVIYWARYGRAVIPNCEGKWVANRRSWWAREACLTPGQYNRAARRLAQWGLIEKRQWWFAGKNILFVRPTQLTLDYLSAATTWQAAQELLVELKIFSKKEAIKFTEFGKPGISDSAISNGLSKVGKPSLSKSKISNHIIHSQHSFGMKKKLTSAHPASPPCTDQSLLNQKSVSGKGKTENGHHSHAPTMAQPVVAPKNIKIFDLKKVWELAIKHAYRGQPAPVPSKEIGALARFLQGLSALYGRRGEEDLRTSAPDIIAYAIQHWSEVRENEDPPYPTMKVLEEKLGKAVNIWHCAGRPRSPLAEQVSTRIAEEGADDIRSMRGKRRSVDVEGMPSAPSASPTADMTVYGEEGEVELE